MNNDLKVAFFLPTRLGSIRVINKNTRKFAGFEGGIFELKLNQLIKSKKIAEIIVSTNDPICIKIAEQYHERDSRIKVIVRPNHLCLDTTNLTDLINYVPTLTNMDHILWGHTTTPLIDAEMYDKAIECYQNNLLKGKDSLISVCRIQNFLLDEQANVINNNTAIQWPRTQDLNALYEINHAIFLTSRITYLKDKNRIGKIPFLFEMDKIESVDVDWEEDFIIAETLYEKFKQF